ncbi:hypothetical protein CCY99_07135 [Helicobacter sp. 16-1353]|uniref:class I SAM-dependent methyltransferase n=1 Tax=Helicobacter sp. 16-1353 TaxID=2004996 RepID=UPI000DCC16EE|nr:methyltransferase domain-containing protein [Helicobacter sp. 16-1353]RAX52734.1 hypothetical protein CCY99_07135 [Helicobacter sp. 16-1353]
MNMINIACGARIHDKWENIDFSPIDKRVKKVNLLGKLPYKDSSFDVAYSSHFFEHLDKKVAPKLLGEIKRILKPNGILRIVVPDLENIAREYIKILDSITDSGNLDSNKSLDSIKSPDYKNPDSAKSPESHNVAYKHEWIVAEMLDQLARTQMGGGLLEIFNKVKGNNDLKYARYIKLRVGDNVLENPAKTPKIPIKNKITLDKLANKILNVYLKFVRFLIPKSLRDEVFINTSIGERHKYMYDRYSLSRLLESCGFREIRILSYNTSEILDFNSYLLDMNADNSPYKGISSLYIECKK